MPRSPYGPAPPRQGGEPAARDDDEKKEPCPPDPAGLPDYAAVPRPAEGRIWLGSAWEELPWPGEDVPYPMDKRPVWRGRVHLCAAAAAAASGAGLLAGSAAARRPAVVAHAAATCVLFAVSAALHTLPWSASSFWRMKRADHSFIYIFIASSYTVLIEGRLGPTFYAALIGTLWGLAAMGVVTKLFCLDAPKWISTALYIGVGWSGVCALPSMFLAGHCFAAGMILLGGVFYTAGGVLFAKEVGLQACGILETVFGPHELFHVFIVLGVAAHWSVVYVAYLP